MIDVFRKLFGRGKPQWGKPTPPIKVSRKFHAVEIIPGKPCCTFATQIAGSRILSYEAPPLPLAACHNHQECKCVYKHHADRRIGLRRDVDIGLPERQVMENRRYSMGRRAEDRLRA